MSHTNASHYVPICHQRTTFFIGCYFLFQMNSPIWIIFLLTITTVSHASSSSSDDENYISCLEVSTELRFPCLCALGPIETALDGNPSISVNCDRTVFPGDFPVIPYGAPIVSFSQRWVGHQSLPTQVSYEENGGRCIQIFVVSRFKTIKS